jgi:glycyl-tRNA synthetase
MDLYNQLSELGRRRAIFYPAFEIYGGVSGFNNYGPIGSLLKRNIEQKWRQRFVYREGMVELETTITMPEQVFLASGHVTHFTDIMTRCSQCGKVFRVDLLLNDLKIKNSEGLAPQAFDALIAKHGVNCLDCKGKLLPSEPFNLMFQTHIGSLDTKQIGYGRPEAGQGQFLDFKRLYAAAREKLPLGVAQIGRCVRNEIAPRKGPIRLREFTIIDYEIFFDPKDHSYPAIKLIQDQRLRILSASEQLAGSDTVKEATVRDALAENVVGNEILCYFMALAVTFLEELGIPFNKQRLREQLPDEKAHYSEQTFDQEVWLDRWGWTEVSGHAYRTDYDLRNHMTHSGEDFRVYKPFETPQNTIQITVKPIKESLIEDFGNRKADQILQLLSKSDLTIVARELQTKGFYELTGRYPVKLAATHLRIEEKQVEATGRYFIPHVVEPSFGIDRIVYATLEYAYSRKKKRIHLALPRDIAPIKVMIYPLVSRDGLPDIATHVYRNLLDEGFVVRYDSSGSIGRRYARADEIGVPICITIDYQSVEDNTVTLRDLYTWTQVRTAVPDLVDLLQKYYRKKCEFTDLGELL